jgi:hypothetical protein
MRVSVVADSHKGEWNKPVHHFFRRHVYSASKNHMSRPVATIITFLISALAHELVMGCITRKFRGYGFIAMMLQMPIVMVQRSRWVRGRTLLNNVLFWCSMILGLSMVSDLNIRMYDKLTLSRCVLCTSLSSLATAWPSFCILHCDLRPDMIPFIASCFLDLIMIDFRELNISHSQATLCRA